MMLPSKFRRWIFLAFIIFITGCVSGPKVDDSTKNIAVWDLEVLSTIGDGRPDVGEFLSVRIIETIKKMEGWNVIERERLALALEELNLGTSSLSDESTKLRLGKLIGAQLMIFGGYQVIAEQMRVDLRVVEVGSGRILKATEKTVPSSDLSGWLNAVEEAAQKLLKNL